MYVLVLNDMRAPKIENLQPVARSENPQDLVDLLLRETVEGYKEGKDNAPGHWNKSFRKGGLLEWFNPPWFPWHVTDEKRYSFERLRDERLRDDSLMGGIDQWVTEEQLVEQTVREYRSQLDQIPVASTL